MSCGLHAIPSNVFKASSSPADHRADLVGLMRKKSFMISPPEDAIELGERVWALSVGSIRVEGCPADGC